VNIGEYSPRQSPSEYSPMFTEPEANNFFSIIFSGEYQGLQNNGLKHKTLIVRLHTRMYIDCESIYSSTSAVKLTRETLRKINSSGNFVLSLLTSFIIVNIV